MSAQGIEAIKEAIAKLPRNERVSLASWLNIQTMDDWDKQMEKDLSPGGRGEWLMDEVESDLSEGNPESLEEGFARRRSLP
jgi:hypothetical protein